MIVSASGHGDTAGGESDDEPVKVAVAYPTGRNSAAVEGRSETQIGRPSVDGADFRQCGAKASIDHADVKIRIGEFELPAHGLVLAAHSPYFKKALKGNFQESESKTFEFSKGIAHAYWRVFEFMYTSNYSEEVESFEAQGGYSLLKSQNSADLRTDDADELTKHVQVYVLADFFLMLKLKRFAV
ncbi:hypothetical protein CH63R_02154 [Colletotrichum higginsianum IMI 349063]|uniref:BTB domain-containing protein n=1 Tax=Colletotrichum higginsianum (strain IMI 349063) TaxID=759273 RepID=A0A1B7YNF7_COLHI|nr:hypothetical protein CH63R_02154 [Colletotrichum higginsianum IMI 349063]OBR13428.1 hypothetical protein CH63R_02154 [Colletotrichum higginsianum IMI 349063]